VKVGNQKQPLVIEPLEKKIQLFGRKRNVSKLYGNVQRMQRGFGLVSEGERGKNTQRFMGNGKKKAIGATGEQLDQKSEVCTHVLRLKIPGARRIACKKRDELLQGEKVIPSQKNL